MNKNDALGNRMKTYENVTRNYLTRRMPVIIRIDGKSFHTFTRGFKRPFDDVLVKSMQDTMKYLCENIQGCVLGYTQSDEITLVLVDYQNRDTSAWFDNNIQKMASVSASMATMAFNEAFSLYSGDWAINNNENTNVIKTYKAINIKTFININPPYFLSINKYHVMNNNHKYLLLFHDRLYNTVYEDRLCYIFHKFDHHKNNHHLKKNHQKK